MSTAQNEQRGLDVFSVNVGTAQNEQRGLDVFSVNVGTAQNEQRGLVIFYTIRIPPYPVISTTT